MARPARNTASTLHRNKVKGIRKQPKPNPERSAHKLRSSFYSQKAIDTFAQECYREYRLQREGNNNARHLDTDEILAFCLGLVNCGRQNFQRCLDIYEGRPRLQNIVPLVFHPQNPEMPEIAEIAENAENSEMSDIEESYTPPFLPSIYPIPVSNQPDSPFIPTQNNQVIFPLNEIQSNPFYQNVVDVFEVSHSLVDTNIQPPFVSEIYSLVGESCENIHPFSSFIFSSSLDPQLEALENFLFSDLPERPC